MTDLRRGQLPQWSESLNGKPSQKTHEIEAFVNKMGSQHKLSYPQGVQLIQKLHGLPPQSSSWTIDHYSQSFENPTEHVDIMLEQVSDTDIATRLPCNQLRPIYITDTESDTNASSDQSSSTLHEYTPVPYTPWRECMGECEAEGVSSSENEQLDPSKHTYPLGLKVKGNLSQQNCMNLLYSHSLTLRTMTNSTTTEILVGPRSKSSKAFLVHHPLFGRKRQVSQIFDEIKQSPGVELWQDYAKVSFSKGTSYIRPVRHTISQRTPAPQPQPSTSSTRRFSPSTRDTPDKVVTKPPGYGPPKLPIVDFSNILLPLFYALADVMTKDDLAVWKTHPSLHQGFSNGMTTSEHLEA